MALINKGGTMRSCKYIVLLLVIASFVFAMPNIYGTMGLIKSITADNGSSGTFDFGFYARGYYIKRVATSTGDSIGNAWAGTDAKYGAGDIGLLIGYSFTDWLALNAAWVYLGEGIDYEGTDDNRASIGLGDTKIGLKLNTNGEIYKYGLYTFVSIPTGDDRDLGSLSVEDYPIFNVCYKNDGGVFRYYSSDGFDIGAVGLFTAQAGKVRFDLNLGYVFANAEGGGMRDNYSIYNAAVSMDGGWIVPFVEISGIDYPDGDDFFTITGDSLWGANPVYITPGLSLTPGDFAITFAYDIRGWEGENTRAFPTAMGDSFNVATGFGATPDWVAHFGVTYTHDFSPEVMTGIIAGSVTDSKTKKPLAANVGVYLEGILLESKVSDVDGLFKFKKLEPDIHKLTAGATGYKPYEVDLLVKPGETTPVTIALEPIPKEGVLILSIFDIESKKPLMAKVIVGEMVPEKSDGKFQKTLLAGTFKLKVVAEDETYLPYERDVKIDAGKTLEIEVPLVKKAFKIVLPQVYFETAKSDIKPESYAVLDKAAKTIEVVLAGNPNIKIEVQGHTDSIGSDSYNMGLSNDRANSVKSFLVTRHDIGASRLIAKGYGESQPIASNKTLSGRAQNRRVEFVIIK